MNMKLNDLYPSNWLKAADIGDEPLVLTIDRIEVAEMQDGQRKPAVYFKEEDRGLILNKTNANTIAAIYGDDTDDWIGQKVQLLAVPVDFQGKTVEAIRIRVRQGKPAAKPQPLRASYAESKARIGPGAQGQNIVLEDDEIPF